jgi:OOP family OmpA-OmpF porin
LIFCGVSDREWKLQAESPLITRRNIMTKSFDKKQIGLALACALALGILSGPARAQDASPQTAKDRLFVDSSATIVKSGFGLCWHSGFGPPPPPGNECEPRIVAYVAPPPPVLKSEPVPPPQIAAAPPPAVVAPAPPPQIYVPPPRPAKRDRN